MFSTITVGVLALIISLVSALIFFIVGGEDGIVVYAITYFTLALATLIILIPIFFYKRIKKLIIAICLNISIVGFSFYILGVIGIITMHQKDACRDDLKYSNDDYDCNTLIDLFEFGWSWILLFFAIIFIFI
ncbi:hypothetical protein ES692_01810 [Psychroserpens burtonensis]|uniref:Uncharacterized protein n=1 Tax=Psychroserpens burtonensis TaxID=49278 RepID=A0A5C7BCJ4_9FLAO|nr:hypothetical protein [Psychroserpens burtonensis]TXE20020.1 hypothetical protein ES692_01810 [Psychroserpens burtonensis]